MNAPDYHGRRGCPPPPPEIKARMEAAGAADDAIALGIAHAEYVAWLADEHGITDGPHGTDRPDSAVGA